MNSNCLELTNTDLQEIFKEREKDTHKGTYGYVGIIGGCMEYTGAIKLANMSSTALRAGCGVVRVIVPKSVGKQYCSIFTRTNYVLNRK